MGGIQVDPERHPLMEHPNRGKRSVGIDVSTPGGQEVIYELAKTADVFYAWESPTGAIEWYFCDGARVVSEAGETWHVPAPPEVHTRATPAPAGYLKAAKKYPDSEIRRPPAEARAGSTPP